MRLTNALSIFTAGANLAGSFDRSLSESPVMQQSDTRMPAIAPPMIAAVESVGASRQLTPFRVNAQTAGNQYHPAIASLSDGGYIITWHSPDNTASTGVFAQRFTASGDYNGPNFQVNTHTTLDQGNMTTAGFPNGQFIIVWHSQDQDGSNKGVYAQLYDASAVRIGTEFQVNSYTANDQMNPDVAVLPDGSFLITWESALRSGSPPSIFARRYHADGTAIGIEFQVSPMDNGLYTLPKATAFPDGGFAIAWQTLPDNGQIEIAMMAQYYDPAGSKQGDAVVFEKLKEASSLDTVPDTIPLSLTMLPTKESVIALSTLVDTRFELHAQRYNQDGTKQVDNHVIVDKPSGSDFIYVPVSSGSSVYPDGRYVLVYVAQSSMLNDQGVLMRTYLKAQRYNADGTVWGRLITIYTDQYQLDLENPTAEAGRLVEIMLNTVQALSNGGFVVSWTHTQQGSQDVIARHFTEEGEALTITYTPDASVVSGATDIAVITQLAVLAMLVREAV